MYGARLPTTATGDGVTVTLATIDGTAASAASAASAAALDHRAQADWIFSPRSPPPLASCGSLSAFFFFVFFFFFI